MGYVEIRYIASGPITESLGCVNTDVVCATRRMVPVMAHDAPPVVCKWTKTYLQPRGFLSVKGNETAWLPGLHIVKDPPTAATNRKTAACWSAVQQLEAVLAGNGFLWMGDTSDTPIYDNVVSWEHGDETWDFWFSDKPRCQKKCWPKSTIIALYIALNS